MSLGRGKRRERKRRRGGEKKDDYLSSWYICNTIFSFITCIRTGKLSSSLLLEFRADFFSHMPAKCYGWPMITMRPLSALLRL